MNINNYLAFDAAEGLQSEYLSILPEGYESFADIDGLSRLGIDALIGEVASVISGSSGEIGAFFLTLLGISLIIAVSSLVTSSMSAIINAGVSAVVSAAIFLSLYPLFTSVCRALSDMNSFFSALVPILLSYLGAGGGVNTALGASSGLGVTLWLSGFLDTGVLVPLVCAVLAISAFSVLGGVGERIASGTKSLFLRLVGIAGTVVASVFALQTYISVSADSLGMRAARYAASGLVPVVGATVSGALSTLVGGLSLAGSVIGASSVAVIVAMALSPFILLLAYKLALFLASSALELLGKGAASCISAFSSALDCLISVYVMTTIIYIFEIILLIWGGNSIIGA